MRSSFNRRVPFLSFLLAAVVLVFTASAYGQNLVTNPDLSTNTSGWTISGTGSVPFQTTLGSPTPGSVSLIANAGQTDTISQCVALTASTIDFGMREYAQFGNVGSTVQLSATFFSASPQSLSSAEINSPRGSCGQCGFFHEGRTLPSCPFPSARFLKNSCHSRSTASGSA